MPRLRLTNWVTRMSAARLQSRVGIVEFETVVRTEQLDHLAHGLSGGAVEVLVETHRH
jgi:hypothetical protein